MRFKVIEEYPQASIRRVMIVEAPTRKDAEENPHAFLVRDDGYDIDEGGEAVTVKVERVSRAKRKR